MVDPSVYPSGFPAWKTYQLEQLQSAQSVQRAALLLTIFLAIQHLQRILELHYEGRPLPASFCSYSVFVVGDPVDPPLVTAVTPRG